MKKFKLITAALSASVLIGTSAISTTPILANEVTEQTEYNIDAYIAESDSTSTTTTKSYVVDEADLITTSEESSLTSKLESISNRLNFDVVVVTTTSTGSKTATEYADDYFDYNDYGRGSNGDGVLLLVDTGGRDWAISTKGYGITAFNGDALSYTEDEVVTYLKDGEYYDAFNRFADITDSIVTDAKAGKTYSAPKDIVGPIVISLIIAAFISMIIMLSYRKKLKPVSFEPEAKAYVVPGSMNIRRTEDLFAYSSMTKVPIPKNDGDSGSGTHTSSSGSTHGGSSGSF